MPFTTTCNRSSTLCTCALAFSIIIGAARSPESSPISVDDLSVDPELSVLSTPASSAAESPLPSLMPSSTSSPLSPAPDQNEAHLARHFPGWVWSERSKDNHAWRWEYGYDIQRHNERRWICKQSIQKNDPKHRSLVAVGL